MSTLHRLSVYSFILICWFGSGCSEKKKADTVTISIDIPSFAGKDFRLSFNNNLDEAELAKVKLDSAGKGTVELTVHNPMFAYIGIEGKYSEAYLTPKTDFTVSLSKNEQEDIFHFSGDNAAINNYLEQSTRLAEKIKTKNNSFICHLETPRFVQRFDSLKTALTGFFQTYRDSVAMADDIRDLLEKKISLRLAAVALEFAYVQQWEKSSAAGDTSAQQYALPAVAQETIDQIPFDSLLVETGAWDFGSVLRLLLHSQIYPQFAAGKSMYIESRSHRAIQNGHYPPAAKEFLLALNIHSWLVQKGITPATDSIFNSFKNIYSHSRHLPPIQKFYNEWLAIAPGNKAPDFTGTTPEGKSVSLHDLAGKVVYIDTWATWCGPCRAEIPHAKTLQKEFANNSRIVFVNISIDSDTTAWKKMVAENKTWGGIHINQNPEQAQAIQKNYKIIGIPTYILVDTAGKIVSVSAKRPSEAGVKEDIAALLK